MEQEEIIRGCKNRNEHAFRLLVDSYAEFAFSLAFRILNDEAEANDAVQESFISVWNKIDSFNTNKNFSNWLYRIIVNKCYDALRRQKKNAHFSMDDTNWNPATLLSDNTSDTNLNNKEIGKIIRLLTQKLSPKQKIVFILCELQGLSHPEISEISGLGMNSVKSNLNHARRNIGIMLEKYL